MEFGGYLATETHHLILKGCIMDKVFVLVISMWGNNGTDWEYIGNQMVLQQDMTKSQCEYMVKEDMWKVYRPMHANFLENSTNQK